MIETKKKTQLSKTTGTGYFKPHVRYVIQVNEIKLRIRSNNVSQSLPLVKELIISNIFKPQDTWQKLKVQDLLFFEQNGTA